MNSLTVRVLGLILIQINTTLAIVNETVRTPMPLSLGQGLDTVVGLHSRSD
jgi:hypothetical protein